MKGVDGLFPHRRGAWIDLKAAYRVQFGIIPIENIDRGFPETSMPTQLPRRKLTQILEKVP